MTLDHLAEKNLQEQRALKKADEALQNGLISQAEYNYFLQKELNITKEAPQNPTAAYTKKPTLNERRKETGVKAILTISVIAFVLMSIYIFMPGGGLTGFVSYEPTSEDVVIVSDSFTTNTNYTLNMTNITGLKVTGVLTDGSASIHLVTETDRLLVWEGNALTETYSVTTDKESYANNSNILASVTPADATYTLWLTDEDGGKSVVQETFTAEVGVYTLDALINDSGNITKVSTSFTVRNDTNVTNDIVRAPVIATTAFNNACVETCELEASSGELVLEITLSDSANLDIAEIMTLKGRTNSAPEQVLDLPDVTIEEGASRIITLDAYFTDADGDALTYDFMNAPGVEMNIEGNTLTLTGVTAGEGQSIIYASDLYSLTQSNMFTITVLPGTQEQNNQTVKETVNETITQPQNDTNITIPGLDCSDPDPNKRPLGCLQQQADQYFKPQAILIEDLDRNTAARITPIGNLLITGQLIEYSVGAPGARDFVVWQKDEFGNLEARAWITDGNLNLRGSIYEEQLDIYPSKGSYSIQNSQSVTIAYIDRDTGNLYIRGNLIPYRRTLE